MHSNKMHRKRSSSRRSSSRRSSSTAQGSNTLSDGSAPEVVNTLAASAPPPRLLSILLFCPHFHPDLQAATGEVMTQLVHGLADRGHRITVVTALPWYRHHDVEPEWRGRPWRRESMSWGQIIRAWPFPTDKSDIMARAAGFAGQTALASALGMMAGRHDVVMGMSPPIFFGDAAWLAARRSRAPLVFNTQDIFPDVAVGLGALNSRRVIELARRHERSIYRRANAVTVLSDDQADNVRAKVVDPSKIHIIQNFADTERIVPSERENWYRHKHGLNDKTVVMYSGNVGLSQSFDLIRAAAERWRGDPSIVFVINGEGAARPDVDAWAADLANVVVVDFSPRDLVADVLAAADLHLVLLKSGLARASTPSKLYSILAAGRPVLASVDEGSEVCTVIARAQAGLSVRPEDESVFCAALDDLLADGASSLQAMGARGRRYAEQGLSPEAQALAYESLFLDLVG